MTDHEARQIAHYLPHLPDTSLEVGEYFFRQNTMNGERVIRVFALDVLPMKDGTEYVIYKQHGGRLVKVDLGWGDQLRGVRMGLLYDDKQDCKDATHDWVDSWEKLRDLQHKEGIL